MIDPKRRIFWRIADDEGAGNAGPLSVAFAEASVTRRARFGGEALARCRLDLARWGSSDMCNAPEVAGELSIVR